MKTMLKSLLAIAMLATPVAVFAVGEGCKKCCKTECKKCEKCKDGKCSECCK